MIRKIGGGSAMQDPDEVLARLEALQQEGEQAVQRAVAAGAAAAGSMLTGNGLLPAAVALNTTLYAAGQTAKALRVGDEISDLGDFIHSEGLDRSQS
jgi:hypothetical protein